MRTIEFTEEELEFLEDVLWDGKCYAEEYGDEFSFKQQEMFNIIYDKFIK